MPNVNAKEAGDNFFPQYNVVVTCLVGAIAIVKGNLYTKNAADQLIAPGDAGFINGMYQATENIPTAGAAGANTVQCYGPRSRIGIDAKDADLHAGHKVMYNKDTGDVSKFTTANNNVTLNELSNIVGRIFIIKSKDNIETVKAVTVAGDLVIIDFGGGY